MQLPPAATLLHEARTSAGLSQRALARRAGTAQSVIARIERGLTSPTWETLERLLQAANLAVRAELEPRVVVGSHMLDDVPRILAMTPEQRLEEVKNLSEFLSHAAVSETTPPPIATLDPKRLFSTLAKHGVQFVLIGALAARLQGFPRATYDVDITPAKDRDNLQRLAAALSELDARFHTDQVPEGLAFDCSPHMLARADSWNLITLAGRLDLAFRPSGTTGYDDLASHAVHFEVYGHDLVTARLEDIIRSKEAANRPQDRQDAEVMREMLKRQRGRPSE